jgi:putative acetyltransferase
VIRRAEPGDAAAIGRAEEADLVEALAPETEVSLVATEGDDVIGHVLLSRAHVGEGPVLALAPLGVLPAHQSSGIGRALTRAALDAARETDFPLVVVLGHPAYYAKLGFEPASRFRIRPPFPVDPPEAFRIARLPAYVEGLRGTVRYPPAFGAV